MHLQGNEIFEHLLRILGDIGFPHSFQVVDCNRMPELILEET